MAVSRATPPLLKDLNERTVLEAIRTAAPISRAEISRLVGISKPTVSQALVSLLGAGLVRETALVLGIDLGARFVRGALCDLRGAVRTRQDLELGVPLAGVALDSIASLVSSLLESGDVSRDLVDGVVLGVPGAVDGGTGR